MKRFAMALLASSILIGVSAMPAFAQSYLRPAVSPYDSNATVSSYLNLFSNNSMGMNYIARVRPQQEMTSSIQQLQRQTDTSMSTLPSSEANPTALTTGHATRFANSEQFFNTGVSSTLFSKPVTAATKGQGNSHH